MPSEYHPEYETMMQALPEISFIVPLFNTGGGLSALFQAFRELRIDVSWEVIFVDDGSADGTADSALQLIKGLPNASLIELTRNYGEHAAVLEGLRHARGDCSVTLDDDLQNPLAEAVRLAQRLRSCDAEVVYGRYTTKQHHWLRNAGSRAVNALASFLLNKPRTLYLSSFRALRRELSARIIEYRGPYPHIDSLILNATNRITQLDVTHFPRAHGRSGYTTRKLLRLAMNLCFDSSVMPLRIASVLGALLCCAGGVLLGEVFVEELTVGRVQPGWASLMGALAAFSGAQLLMLGLIGEYVGRAFLTVSGKPQSHLRTVHRHQSEL